MDKDKSFDFAFSSKKGENKNASGNKQDRLIEMILQNERIRKHGNADCEVYRDEPIIRTAAQMKNYLPQKYHDMKKIAKNFDAYRKSYEQLFYEQGKFMEDFEDDYDYRGEFLRYYPTYRDMNDFQLRGYFSWRTKVRRGQIEKTSLSFVYMYIYELLNQIGVSSPLDGFEKLQTIWSEYRIFEPSIDRYLKPWITDYVAYYGLDIRLLDGIVPNTDRNLKILQFYKEHNEDELFDAICAFSTYNIQKSKFYKDHSEDVKSVICRVFTAESDYAATHRKYTYFEQLFGKLQTANYSMFLAAVFYPQKKYRQYIYHINDYFSYSCENGKWKCTRLLEPPTPKRELGQLLKTVDGIMRRQYHYTPALKEMPTTKLLYNMILKQIDAREAEKKQQEKLKIDIDLSKLDDIRRAAESTRDKLLVEEADTELLFSVSEEPLPKEPTNRENPNGLTDNEMLLLHCFLYGGDSEKVMREKGLMPSVVIESVNEKLFDFFGDIVIDFNGERAVLIEDYIEELKGLIKP